MPGRIQEPSLACVAAVRARHAPEFFAWPPLVAVALFTLNNFWLKGRAPGIVSGKLSDFAACFFLPLFVSALLGKVTPLRLQARVALGAAVTVLVFSLVKTSPLASSWLDALCAAFGSLVSRQSPNNCVDPSDLIALPMVLGACLWARAVDRRTA
jgi:hypothetical protein